MGQRGDLALLRSARLRISVKSFLLLPGVVSCMSVAVLALLFFALLCGSDGHGAQVRCSKWRASGCCRGCDRRDVPRDETEHRAAR